MRDNLSPWAHLFFFQEHNTSVSNFFFWHSCCCRNRIWLWTTPLWSQGCKWTLLISFSCLNGIRDTRIIINRHTRGMWENIFTHAHKNRQRNKWQGLGSSAVYVLAEDPNTEDKSLSGNPRWVDSWRWQLLSSSFTFSFLAKPFLLVFFKLCVVMRCQSLLARLQSFCLWWIHFLFFPPSWWECDDACK